MASVSTNGHEAYGDQTRAHILFLTTHALSDLAVRDWNSEILEVLVSRQVDFDTKSFLQHADILTPRYVAEHYTHVCFLLLGEYPPYHNSLMQQLRIVLPAAQQLNPHLKILNGPRMAVWNSDKSYLRDLREAGFPIPDTTVLSARQPVDFVKFALNTQAHENAIVVKPTISADGKNTHLISRPKELTDDDNRFLRSLLDLMQNSYHQSDVRSGPAHKASTSPQVDDEHDENEGNYGSVILQEFVPEVADGEYSLCYIGGQLRYTFLKRPKQGGWLVGSQFGGTFDAVPDNEVPADAVSVSRRVCEWVRERFDGEELAYARVDGICREDGSFVIIEIELLEPSLFISAPAARSVGSEAIGRLFA